MQQLRDFQIVATNQVNCARTPGQAGPGGDPFKVVIDPKVRMDLRRALIDLIDYHDEALAENFAEGKLALDSYKEYIELFARSLKETMESREGVSYLLRSVGFESAGGDQFGSRAALETRTCTIRSESAVSS